MSALGHYLEEEGLATLVLSLVREQSDKVAPPRTLWVPFELGRPLGEPENAQFQRAVLRSLFALLDEPSGPVSRDYNVEQPSLDSDAAWSAPDLAEAGSVDEELMQLTELHTQFMKRAGRTTALVSGLTLREAAAFVEGYPQASRPPSLENVSDLMRLRFAADDLKAHYLEAASVAGGRPATRQLGQWLWEETRLGAALTALMHRSVASDDEKLALVGGKFIVPVNYR